MNCKHNNGELLLTPHPCTPQVLHLQLVIIAHWKDRCFSAEVLWGLLNEKISLVGGIRKSSAELQHLQITFV